MAARTRSSFSHHSSLSVTSPSSSSCSQREECGHGSGGDDNSRCSDASCCRRSVSHEPSRIVAAAEPSDRGETSAEGAAANCPPVAVKQSTEQQSEHSSGGKGFELSSSPPMDAITPAFRATGRLEAAVQWPLSISPISSTPHPQLPLQPELFSGTCATPTNPMAYCPLLSPVHGLTAVHAQPFYQFIYPSQVYSSAHCPLPDKQRTSNEQHDQEANPNVPVSASSRPELNTTGTSSPCNVSAPAAALNQLQDTPPLTPVSENGADETFRAKSPTPHPHACPWPGCKKAYIKKSHLKVHYRVHTGERPYRCSHPGCTRAFTRSDELTRHRCMHTGEKRYWCPLCRRGFVRSDHLTKHMHRHTDAQRMPGWQKEVVRLRQMMAAGQITSPVVSISPVVSPSVKQP